MQPSTSSTPFGQLPDGRRATLYTLVNANGMRAAISDFGAILASLQVPDRAGKLANVVLGYDTLQAYVDDPHYLGALVGRYANRVRHGRFRLDGRMIQLPLNHGAHHLHGGPGGFHKVLWRARPYRGNDAASLLLVHRSAHGEQGYPGQLAVRVLYQLNNHNQLVLRLHAVSDRPTPVNLTQHAYFNLGGGGNILGHTLQIDADTYTPVDGSLIPTGALAPVSGTPFDFRAPRLVGGLIDTAHEQLAHGGGYDHNFVLRRGARRAARLSDPGSGRVLELCTTEPGLQFYSGNFLDGIPTQQGLSPAYRCGLCLEPQHYPDSPNQAAFPDTILRPGAQYASLSTYTFSAE